MSAKAFAVMISTAEKQLQSISDDLINYNTVEGEKCWHIEVLEKIAKSLMVLDEFKRIMKDTESQHQMQEIIEAAVHILLAHNIQDAYVPHSPHAQKPSPRGQFPINPYTVKLEFIFRWCQKYIDK